MKRDFWLFVSNVLGLKMRAVFCLATMCVLLTGVTPKAVEPASFWNDYAQAELSYVESLVTVPNTNTAKNVIFFIGDGMGVSTVTAMRILHGQNSGESGEEGLLSFEKFPYVAYSKTYNTDAQVSDSAGTATAFMNGVKTKMGVVGYDDTVQRRNCSSASEAAKLTSILDWSRDEGKSVGIISTARITHATPSAAYANSVERDWENDADLPPDAQGVCVDIAAQLIEKAPHLQVVLGGGRRSFMTNNETDPEYPTKKGKRKDGRKLLREWEERLAGKSFRYVWNRTDFERIDPLTTDHLLGLFEPGHMQYKLDRNETMEPSLVEMTEKAIKILSKNDKGFFLFVEGGRIDHGHHAGKAAYALSEGVELSDAVAKAMTLIDTKETLVVVSADHSHVFTIGAYAKRGNPILGFVDTADIDKSNTAEDNRPYTTLLYGNGPGFSVNGTRTNITGVNVEDKNYRQQSAVPLSSETHGGEDVPIYATGPMAHLFTGVREQNYLPHAMAYAACVGPNKKHCEKRKGPTQPPSPGPRTTKRPINGGHTRLPNTAAVLVALVYVLTSVVHV